MGLEATWVDVRPAHGRARRNLDRAGAWMARCVKPGTVGDSGPDRGRLRCRSRLRDRPESSFVGELSARMIRMFRSAGRVDRDLGHAHELDEPLGSDGDEWMLKSWVSRPRRCARTVQSSRRWISALAAFRGLPKPRTPSLHAATTVWSFRSPTCCPRPRRVQLHRTLTQTAPGHQAYRAVSKVNGTTLTDSRSKKEACDVGVPEQ